jgi:hypothetical protein
VKPIELLRKYELTSPQLAARLGIGKKTARHHVLNLRRANLVRIVRWEKSGKQTVPVYGAGCGKDAPKPPPQPRLLVRLRYNEKNRAVVRLKNRKAPVTPWDVLGVKNIVWGQV